MGLVKRQPYALSKSCLILLRVLELSAGSTELLSRILFCFFNTVDESLRGFFLVHCDSCLSPLLVREFGISGGDVSASKICKLPCFFLAGTGGVVTPVLCTSSHVCSARDFRCIKSSKYAWHDSEYLPLFSRSGSERVWLMRLASIC